MIQVKPDLRRKEEEQNEQKRRKKKRREGIKGRNDVWSSMVGGRRKIVRA